MNKLFSGVMLVLLCVFSAKAQAPDWGPADTVECHKIGPGINYTKIIYHKLPTILWWTEIDLSNEFNKVEQVQSRHQVPDVLRWDIMTHYKENSRPGHQVKVAWNHDFFSYDDGICIGMNISEGEMTWRLWGRSLLAITKGKKAEVFNPNNIECKAITPDGTSVAIDSYNASAQYLTGDCILFNKMNSLNLTEAGLYIKIQPQAEWLVNGADIPCKVTEISTTPLQTSATDYVLYLRNTKLSALDSHINVGDMLKISQKFNGASWGTTPADILNAFHGYPSLAHDGVLHNGEYNDFENGREYEKSAHVLAGISKDKTKLFILLNEMSSNSQSLDCVEMTNWMLAHGAWDVVNFDSGGSAAIAVDGDMLNLPGRGSVRPIEDAMIAVSLAPEDNNIDHLAFSKPHISPSTISLTPLRVMGFNKYDEVLEKDIKGCSFTCEPATIGTVDAEGIFHSGEQGMTGKIIAQKDGKTAELLVDTRTAEGVAPSVSNILINGIREYLIPITGTYNGETFTLDAAAFNWANSSPECCSIENGVLRGLKNGTSVITASFGNLTFDINVKVEIPQKNTAVVDNFQDISTLGLSYSGVSGMTADAANLPTGWSDGATYKFNITSSRAPSFKVMTPYILYSLPDSLSFQLYNKDQIVKQVSANYTDALGAKGIFSFTMPSTDDGVLTLPFKDGTGNIFDTSRYPITLTRLTFTLQSSKAGTGYEIGLRNLVAHYSEGTSSVGSILSDDNNSKLVISVEPELVKASFISAESGKARVMLYSTSGQILYNSIIEVVAGKNILPINTKVAGCGMYILSVNTGRQNLVGKCIIR